MNFSKRITNWYCVNKRDFPWRNTQNPYFIWLSEIILQQTRTTQGLPYYLAFCKAFPTVFDLARSSELKVLKLWQGLGYYSRARNLHFSAKYIVNNLDGKFPNNYKDLLQLKGVGDYTASAIASICFNEKTAVVDGNVYRVLARYFNIKTSINSSKGIKEFKVLAQKLLPNTDIGNHNQAIMDFGATICTPKKPKCSDCIFNESCVALQKNNVLKLPFKPKKTKIRKRYFNYIVPITKDFKTIIHKRVNKDVWLNLYEFPLYETKTEINELELNDAEIYKELIKKNSYINLKLFNPKLVIHKLSHQHIYTKFWIVKLNEDLPKSIPFQDIVKYPVSTLVYNFYKEFKLASKN